MTDGNPQEARLIEAANIYGGEIGKEILRDVQSVSFALVAGYQQTGQSASAAGKLEPVKRKHRKLQSKLLQQQRLLRKLSKPHLGPVLRRSRKPNNIVGFI